MVHSFAGADRHIMCWSGRIFDVLWRICLWIIMTTFTSGFVAYLSATTFEIPFRSLEEFSEALSNEKYKACVTVGSSLEMAIRVMFGSLTKCHTVCTVHNFYNLYLRMVNLPFMRN